MRALTAARLAATTSAEGVVAVFTTSFMAATVAALVSPVKRRAAREDF
jgi:hypothetical protein